MPTPKVKTRRLLLPKHLIQSALDGRLTEHRVPVEPQFTITDSGLWMGNGKAIIRHVGGTRFAKPRVYTDAELLRGCAEHFCPTPVGTLLWVAEAWGIGSRPHPMYGGIDGLEYRADCDGLDESELLPLYRFAEYGGDINPPDSFDASAGSGWRSPATMPQWASRLWFEVTAVRIEREGDKWEWVYTLNRVEAER